MRDEPVWITVNLALAIHSRQLAEHGGADGTRDAGLLDSAIACPRQKFAYGSPTPAIPELAASLAFGLARNHPFIDGNKRTAAVACETFLNFNDFDLTASDEEMYLTFFNLAAGALTEEQLADWLTTHTKKS